jgi:hypothetical protein
VDGAGGAFLVEDAAFDDDTTGPLFDEDFDADKDTGAFFKDANLLLDEGFDENKDTRAKFDEDDEDLAVFSVAAAQARAWVSATLGFGGGEETTIDFLAFEGLVAVDDTAGVFDGCVFMIFVVSISADVNDSSHEEGDDALALAIAAFDGPGLIFVTSTSDDESDASDEEDNGALLVFVPTTIRDTGDVMEDDGDGALVACNNGVAGTSWDDDAD